MTEFYLVRHALPKSGFLDPGLSEEGCQQAHLLGKWLAEERFDAVVASPLRRAVETAKLICEVIGHNSCHYLSELKELQSGDDKEYVPAEQLCTSDPVSLALADGRYADVLPRHQWAEFQERALVCRETLMRCYPSGKVLVVAHGGIINAVLASIIGLDQIFWHYPGYTSISRITRLASGNVVLRSVNEMPHLSSVFATGGAS